MIYWGNFILYPRMSIIDLVEGSHADIQKSVKKLERFRKRLEKGLGQLQQALDGYKDDGTGFERIDLKKAEVVQVFKTFDLQTEEVRNVFDDKCTDEDTDEIYEELMKLKERASMDYAMVISLYEQKKPTPMSDREIRLQKYAKDRDEILASIQKKKDAHVQAKKQLDATATELKEIEDKFKQMNLNVAETGKGVAGVDPIKGVPTVKAERELFDYNSTALEFGGRGSPNLSSVEDELPLFGLGGVRDKVPTQVELQMKLQDALIQKSLLPTVPIESFDGNPLLYRSFRHNFEHTVLRVTSDPATQISQLVGRCKGDALNAIRNKVISGEPKEALKRALEALDREFGQKDSLVRSAKQTLKDLSRSDGSHGSLRKLSCAMENLQDVMIANDCKFGLDGTSITTLVFRKFTDEMQVAFKSQLRSKLAADSSADPKVTFTRLLEFVRVEARCANTNFACMIKERPKSERRGTTSKDAQVYTNSGKTSFDCRYCKSSDHKLHQCPEFKTLDQGQRHEFFKKAGLCFICSGKHLSKECKSTYTCKLCSGRHHVTLACRKQGPRSGDVQVQNGEDLEPTLEDEETEDEEQSEAVIACLGGSVKEDSFTYNNSSFKPHVVRTFVPVLPALACVGKKTLKVNLFLDGGATVTTCSRRLIDKLKPETYPCQMKMSGFITKNYVMRGLRFSLLLKGLGRGFSKKKVLIEHVHWLEGLDMPNFPDSFPKDYDMRKNPAFKNIPFAEADNTQIDILVGRDAPELHLVYEDRSDPSIDKVHACKSAIGWYVAGMMKLPALYLQKPSQTLSLENAGSEEVEGQSPDEVKDHLRNLEKYDFDDPIYSKMRGKSRNDIRAMQVVDNSIHKVGKAYSIALMWKEDMINMPDNRSQAEKRLRSLIPKFRNSPEFHDAFCKKMVENIELHAEEVTLKIEDEATLGTINYIAQFGVCSAGKFRIVNDARAKSIDNLSLNDRLLTGEDMLTSINSVLLRARQHKYWFLGDIKAMFLSVLVNKKDRDALRFLWYDKGDYNKGAIKTYRWTKWCFGLSNAPYAASKALQQTALDNEPGVSSEVVDTILKNCYVDDINKSCRTVDEAIKLALGVIKLCDSGNFEVTKFKANDQAILQGLPADKVATSDQNPEVSLDLHSQSTKVLGMCIDSRSNQYFFKIRPDSGESTRRGVLKYYMRIFDPLGLLNIYILPVKRILQRAVERSLGWDEPFPPDLLKQWKKWKSKLMELQELRIDVCVKPSDDYITIQMHIFSDASKIGYGTCCYIRVDYGSHVKITLVTSKGRICPRKLLSPIKLEVQAAVVGSRVSKTVTQSFDEIKFDQTILWSDSKSFLHMMRNQSKRFELWFAVRLDEVHETTGLSRWRYCPTDMNPADHISRGVMPGDTKRSKSFYEGPEFLKLPEQEWPKHLEEDEEIIACVANLYVVQDEKMEEMGGIHKMIDFYNSSFSLKRAVSFVIRVVKKMLKPEVLIVKGRVTTEELRQAERLIVITIQKRSFPELMKKLTNCETVEEALGSQPAPSADGGILRKLNPILVKGVLRVGGRLSNSLLSEEERHPIILPKDSNFTKLIIDCCHIQSAHLGAQITLASVRKRFWIVHGLRTVKKKTKRLHEL